MSKQLVNTIIRWYSYDSEVLTALYLNGHLTSAEYDAHGCNPEEEFLTAVEAVPHNVNALITLFENIEDVHSNDIVYSVAGLYCRKDLTADHIARLARLEYSSPYLMYHPSCTPELALELTLKHS